MRMPCATWLDVRPYEVDELMVVLPEGHELAKVNSVSLESLRNEPFLALEHGDDSEMTSLYEKAGFVLEPALSTWDDYAIMAMVEKGLGLSVLPSLILQRVPYKIVCKKLDPPAKRHLAMATKKGVPVPVAVSAFMDHLEACQAMDR